MRMSPTRDCKIGTHTVRNTHTHLGIHTVTDQDAGTDAGTDVWIRAYIHARAYACTDM